MHLVRRSPKAICLSFERPFKPASPSLSNTQRDGWGKVLNPQQLEPQQADRPSVQDQDPLDAA